MKSTTCHKQTTTSLTPLIPSDAASHHRHQHSQYRNNSVSSRGSSIKPKPSDANNNDNSSMITMATTATTTTKMPVMTAPTRSKNSEKYSLRQRQKRSFAVPSSAVAAAVISASLKSAEASHNAVTTSSRGRSNYGATVKRPNTSAAVMSSAFKEKSKSKAAPLSKYRRKTANARERTRMREINSAFENLRRCVPHTITGDETTSSNEKLTKITTLRLAMKYIRVLSEALDNPSFQEDFLLECQNDGDHRFSTRDWVQPVEGAVPSEEETHPVATTTAQSRPKVRKTKLQASKATTKRQRTKTKLQDSSSPYLMSSSTFSSPFSSSSSSAYASMSASPLLDDCNSMTDLSSMILESDGESLHLSEPCLSPLNRNYHLGMQSLDGMGGLMKNTPMAIENPLELSLRLLQPDGDSLEFSTDHQPPTCISPLVTLESFNPFGDLLHTEFPEHSALDLFLT